MSYDEEYSNEKDINGVKLQREEQVILKAATNKCIGYLLFVNQKPSLLFRL